MEFTVVLMFCKKLLFIVIKHPTGLCQTKGFSVFFWITLSHEVSRHFPPPHTHQHTRTLRTFYIFAVHQLTIKPLQLAVGGAWDVVVLLPACFCVVVVGLAKVAEHSLSAFCPHVVLFSASEACGAISKV